MIDNFEDLFKEISPKIIVLYCGGNDLAVGLDPDEIFKKLIFLIKMIKEKFKKIKIINIQLKPSIERISKIDKINLLNKLISDHFNKQKNLIQLKCFEDIMTDGDIDETFFLRDGLHLNDKGYELISQKLKYQLNNDY